MQNTTTPRRSERLENLRQENQALKALKNTTAHDTEIVVKHLMSL